MTDSEIEIQLKALIAAQNQALQLIQETRNVVEKLAGVHGLEWSQDLRDFVSKEKLSALRKEPR